MTSKDWAGKLPPNTEEKIVEDNHEKWRQYTKNENYEVLKTAISEVKTNN